MHKQRVFIYQLFKKTKSEDNDPILAVSALFPLVQKWWRITDKLFSFLPDYYFNMHCHALLNRLDFDDCVAKIVTELQFMTMFAITDISVDFSLDHAPWK